MIICGVHIWRNVIVWFPYIYIYAFLFFICIDTIAATGDKFVVQLAKKPGWLFKIAVVFAENLAQECSRYAFQCSLPFFSTATIALSFRSSLFRAVFPRFD